MAQYQEGTVDLSFGDAHVGGVGTRWLSNVKTGDMLLVGSDGPAAFIAAVLSDTELLLEQAWPGIDAARADYAIHRDFDPTTGAPLLAQGDTGLPLVFNRAIGLLSVQTGAALLSSEIAQRAETVKQDSAQAMAAKVSAEHANQAAQVASQAAEAAKQNTQVFRQEAETAAQAAANNAVSAAAALDQVNLVSSQLAAAASFYTASPPDQLTGSSAIGVSLGGPSIEFYRLSSATHCMSPGAAESATSGGYNLRISGGQGGSTSGRSGSLTLATLAPPDGNSGTINIITGTAIGVNRTAGNINISAGAASGTPYGANINIKAGSSHFPGTFGGNTIIGGGDSSSGIPGSLYLDSGIGTADPGNTVVALRNRTLGPIQFNLSGANRWTIDGAGGGGYAYQLRPEVNGAYDLGVPEFRVRDIYLTNSPNISSDERTKLDITKLTPDQCADFVALLQPSLFRLGNAGVKIVGYEDRTETVTGIDPETGEEQAGEITVTVPIEVPREGIRLHAGFIAQEVRDAIGTSLPGLDLALWGLADPSNPDSRQHLRYDQLIAFLVGAVASLRARVEQLERVHPS